MEDYHSFVELDMYFGLIVERLQTQWYRSKEQLYLDLQTITENSLKYNGPEHCVTIDARDIVDFMENELSKIIEPLTPKGRQRKKTFSSYKEFVKDLISKHTHQS